MIITTTMQIEGHPIKEYKGIVFGEVVEGRNFVKDFFPPFEILLAVVAIVMNHL